ncbi:MAG: hypothetical protein E7342_04785 [Clostridiales bacterium]|nr:hypothetical protein [Clostridiales bacterium]
MKKTVEKIFFSLINFEFSKKEIEEEVKNLITTESLRSLYELSKKHDLAHLIADALDKNALFCDEELKKKFLIELNKAVFRDEQRKYEFNKVSDVLFDAKIPFLPLKGIEISKLYPKTWMRTSCDIDILVKKEDLEKTKNILVDRLDYVLKTQTDHDVSLFSKSNVNLELHFSLFDDDRLKDLLRDVWEYTVIENGQFKMTNEMMYSYHIVHMAKHFKLGGIGVRYFIDEWLIRKKLYFTNENELLKKANLLVFTNQIKNVSDVWFEGKENDIFDIEQYVLYSGLYGNLENNVLIKTAKKGKIKFLFSSIFLSFDCLKIQYPILLKHKWLAPFCQVARWFKLLFGKSRKHTKIKLKAIKSDKDKKQEWIKDLFKKLDI